MVLILGANLLNPSPEAWAQEKLTADRDACGCKPILLPQDPTWKIQHHTLSNVYKGIFPLSVEERHREEIALSSPPLECKKTKTYNRRQNC